METLPCRECIVLAICNAKGPFKSWPKMDVLYNKCKQLKSYLNHGCSNKNLLENKRLYETLDFFKMLKGEK